MDNVWICMINGEPVTPNACLSWPYHFKMVPAGWTAIYPVDSVICPSNNRGLNQFCSLQKNWW